jgi:hypothetical protein
VELLIILDTYMTQMLSFEGFQGLSTGLNLAISVTTSIKIVIGTTVAQWLRYCTSNQKVAGLIPDGVIGIFH